MSGDLGRALRYLDAHVNFETAPSRRSKPTLDRMYALCGLLGDPQSAYPVVHLTGTNGKGSTARMVTALLQAYGLSVGTYTSPHLEHINERLSWNGEPVADDVLADALLGLDPLEEHLGEHLTHFELLTAAAFRWFADIAVDVAVVEVGMGGRWDATNVADGIVAVVTNVGLDHTEVIGPTRAEIAAEKAGIVKPGSTLVLGETDPDLVPTFVGRGPVWQRDTDFGCEANSVAHGGRLIRLRTPAKVYEDVFVALHGAHQGDNAACAAAAAEAFFGRALDGDVLRESFATVRVPGRFEILGRAPLVVLDGAHNPDGARALAHTLQDDLAGVAPTVVVAGFTAGRDPVEMLTILSGAGANRIVACRPPHPRGLPASDVVVAARSLGMAAEAAPTVVEAVVRGLQLAGDDGFLLITGSLYVVGEARGALRAQLGH
jgi:dihydrofolate synthase/folylpolyglutamate synthase